VTMPSSIDEQRRSITTDDRRRRSRTPSATGRGAVGSAWGMMPIGEGAGDYSDDDDDGRSSRWVNGSWFNGS
jgi:hypothetical protein